MDIFALKKAERENVRDLSAHKKNYPTIRENRTGIPTHLKERMEKSTGLSLDDVQVHYNSGLPAKLDALAYTQGNHVEIGPGQERHLPHELGHVIQQKLGLVRANAMHSSGVPLNTDTGLERQADEIGAGRGHAIIQRRGMVTHFPLALQLQPDPDEKKKNPKQNEEEEEEENPEELPSPPPPPPPESLDLESPPPPQQETLDREPPSRNHITVTPVDLFAFGKTENPRPARPKDFGLKTETDEIDPTKEPPIGASTFDCPSNKGLTGAYHKLPKDTDLGKSTLAVIADGGSNDNLPGHHTIYPTKRMTLIEFNGKYLNLPWVRNVGRIKPPKK